MKRNIEVAIKESLRRLSNAKTKSEQIERKIENLEKELGILQEKIFNEKELISSIGYKMPSRENGKPDSPEELVDKREYNQRLFEEKKRLLEGTEDPDLLENPSGPASSFEAAIRRMSGEI